MIPRGDETIQSGDRIVVIGSPQAAQAWSELIVPGTRKVTDVVIFGAGRAGIAIARLLLEQEIGVRLIEASRDRARSVAAELPEPRASTTRPDSTRTSSSASGSRTRRSRSSRCATT